MNLSPRIEQCQKKKLVGLKQIMSLSENKTTELWRKFLPRLGEVKNRSSNDLISLQIYGAEYFQVFNPSNTFEKWACVEVFNFDDVPEGMCSMILNSGKYAVFNYKGLSSDTRIFQNIFGVWLPSSAYALDQRPHFEILGERYKNNDVNSEEEILIPLK